MLVNASTLLILPDDRSMHPLNIEFFIIIVMRFEVGWSNVKLNAVFRLSMLSIIMNIVGYYDGFAISPASSSSRSSSSASSGGVAICVARGGVPSP